MNSNTYIGYIKLKKDIIDFTELTNYRFYFIQRLTKTQQIEIILLYDDILSGLNDLTDYVPLNEKQKQYIQTTTTEKRMELIELYNEAIIEINKTTNPSH